MNFQSAFPNHRGGGSLCAAATKPNRPSASAAIVWDMVDDIKPK
jgi:hypothetical protein